MNIKIVNDAKLATGLAVIIDVFRAFTVEPYLIRNGARVCESLEEIATFLNSYDLQQAKQQIR